MPRSPFIALLLALALGTLAGPVSADPLLPWRQQINERLRQQDRLIAELIAQRQAPPAPQPILLPVPEGPRQELPIAGAPKQELPIAGQPKQELPIAGDPKQQLPIAGPPRQQLPIDGPPRQTLPPDGPPQALPQNYTVIRRALAVPRD